MLNYTKDMVKIKAEFATKFVNSMNKNLDICKKIQKECIKELYSFEILYWYIFIALLGLFVIIVDHFREYWICIPVCLLELAILAINIHLKNKKYQSKIKKFFLTTLVNVFIDNVKYKVSRNIPENIIIKSDLYNRDIEYWNYDDKFGGVYKDILFKANETEFGWLSDSKYEKKSIPHPQFQGLALYFKLNKTIKDRVLIISKPSLFKVPKNYQKVEVEYNKFSQKYNTYVNSTNSSGQVEARYLLNTAFIDRFMQIQTSFRVSDVQCSIYKDDMLIMLSTDKDLFEMNHLLGRIDDVKQYEHLFDEFASIFSFIEVLNLSSKTKL